MNFSAYFQNKHLKLNSTINLKSNSSQNFNGQKGNKSVINHSNNSMIILIYHLPTISLTIYVKFVHDSWNDI